MVWVTVTPSKRIEVIMKFEKPVLYTAKPSDASSISRFGEKTFRETFAELNKKQDFEKYVAESFTENKIKSEILDSGSLFYIAKLKIKINGIKHKKRLY